jgi:hypothetical protein
MKKTNHNEIERQIISAIKREMDPALLTESVHNCFSTNAAEMPASASMTTCSPAPPSLSVGGNR